PLRARDTDGRDVRILFPVDGPLNRLEGEHVIVDPRQDVGSRQDAAGVRDAGRVLNPLLAVAGPRGLAEAATRVEGPRPKLAGGVVLADHLETLGRLAV